MNGAVDLPLGQAELSFTAAGDARVRRSVLPSGVRVLSEQVPGSRSATVGFWVAVGSRDEQRADAAHPASYGSTHFLEHLLFKGTAHAHRARHRDLLRRRSAASTTRSRPRSTPATTPRCRTATCRWRSRCSPTCSPRRCSTPPSSRTSAASSSKSSSMAGDDPADVANERFFEAVLGEHPLGRPIGGSPETHPRRHPRRRAASTTGRTTGPQDLVVTVAGAVDHDALLVELERGARRGRLGPLRRRRPGRPALDRAGGARRRRTDSSSSRGPPSRSTCCSACPASSRPTSAARR